MDGLDYKEISQYFDAVAYFIISIFLTEKRHMYLPNLIQTLTSELSATCQTPGQQPQTERIPCAIFV